MEERAELSDPIEALCVRNGQLVQSLKFFDPQRGSIKSNFTTVSHKKAKLLTDGGPIVRKMWCSFPSGAVFHFKKTSTVNAISLRDYRTY